MYYIQDEKTGFFLNHSTLGTCSTGDINMAWFTDDYEKAHLMQFKAQAINKKAAFVVVEL